MYKMYTISSGKNCRMNCEYCTDDSKYGGREHEVEEYFITNKLYEDSVFSVVGGEPSFSINHMKTIFTAISSKISNFKFEMFTNCTNLSKEFIDFVRHDDRISLMLSVEVFGGNKRKIGYENTVSMVKKAVEKHGQFANGIAIVYDGSTAKYIEKTISDYEEFLEFDKAKLMFESRMFEDFRHLGISNDKIIEWHCKSIVQEHINDKLIVSDIVGFFAPNCIVNADDITLSNAELFINGKKIDGDFIVKKMKDRVELRSSNPHLTNYNLETVDIFVNDDLIFHDVFYISHLYKHSHLNEHNYLMSKNYNGVIKDVS